LEFEVKSGIFECISGVDGSVFEVMIRVFLKREPRFIK
jgi:hypothetical protein